MMRDDLRIGILAAWLVSCLSSGEHAPSDFFPPRIEDPVKPAQMSPEDIDATIRSLFSGIRLAEATGGVKKVGPEDVALHKGII